MVSRDQRLGENSTTLLRIAVFPALRTARVCWTGAAVVRIMMAVRRSANHLGDELSHVHLDLELEKICHWVELEIARGQCQICVPQRVGALTYTRLLGKDISPIRITCGMLDHEEAAPESDPSTGYRVLHREKRRRISWPS